MSVPTVPMRTPSADIAIVVSAEFDTTTAELTRAMTIMEVYSVGPIRSELADRNGASVAMMTTPTQPAKNDPTAEMNSATPARPCRAIGWPSRHITIDEGSPGMFSMIAVVEPA